MYTNAENELVVEAHLPHFKEEDISISVDKGSLVINAERRDREEDKEKKYVLRESSSSFYRNIELPERAEKHDITASFADGMLVVRVPLKETSTPTSIPIETAEKAR